MRVLGYARVSTENQVKSGSLEDQTHQFCEFRGPELLDTLCGTRLLRLLRPLRPAGLEEGHGARTGEENRGHRGHETRPLGEVRKKPRDLHRRT